MYFLCPVLLIARLVFKVWVAVLFVKAFLVIAVTAYGPDFMHDFDITPGQIDLMWFKPASCTFGIQMVVVMPFAGNNARPQLIDGFIFLIKINVLALFILPFGMTFIIKGTHANGPETSGTK